jgi:hypothetical protein
MLSLRTVGEVAYLLDRSVPAFPSQFLMRMIVDSDGTRRNVLIPRQRYS